MLIDIRNIEKKYGSGDAEVHALRGISCEIESQDFVAICGPSGSGKTTFLTTLAGMNRPTGGEAVVDEISVYKDLNSEGLAQFRNEYIGFVFQSFHLIPYLSAIENVMLPLAPQSISSAEKKDMAMQALEQVNIPEKARARPGELSGGQSQRAAIARAIVNDPPVILADEPTGNLDTDTRDDILKLLETIRKNGRTIIIVTHDPENIQMAERTLKIQDGMLMQ
jgi:putative ABC transport system ATP-binding protein